MRRAVLNLTLAAACIVLAGLAGFATAGMATATYAVCAAPKLSLPASGLVIRGTLP